MGNRIGWLGNFTRSSQRVQNQLGVIPVSDLKQKRFRNPELDIFDAYYESRQYDKLPPWDQEAAGDDEFIPVRKRQPRINYSLGKALVDRLTAKLVGSDVFPKLTVEDDPDTETFLSMVMKASKVRSKIMEPVKRMLTEGAALIRFYAVQGSLQIESYQAKFCYPEFEENGELKSCRIQYVFTDQNEKDQTGKPVEKWFRLDLGPTSDIQYDNPKFDATGSEPNFQIVQSVQHDLGFVQAEWIRTADDKHSPDGYSVLADIMDFIDELNYSLSQSSQAVSYGQEPQLTVKGLDEDEQQALIKSSLKAWMLGKNGEAEFLNNDLAGVERAIELRDKVKQNIGEITRIVMMDPEKIVGSAQSAKAMEVLFGPLVELIMELRPQLEDKIINLVLKMALTLLQLAQRGEETCVVIPPGYQPASLTVTATWPAVFPMTMQDLLQKVQVGSQATAANVISRETVTRWLAKDFGVENIDEELSKIASQPILNPFGSFGGM